MPTTPTGELLLLAFCYALAIGLLYIGVIRPSMRQQNMSIIEQIKRTDSALDAIRQSAPPASQVDEPPDETLALIHAFRETNNHIGRLVQNARDGNACLPADDHIDQLAHLSDGLFAVHNEKAFHAHIERVDPDFNERLDRDVFRVEHYWSVRPAQYTYYLDLLIARLEATVGAYIDQRLHDHQHHMDGAKPE